MILYGLACLLVVALSLADRRALPFALVILGGWLAGFGSGGLSPDDSWRVWPAISAASSIALFALWKKHGVWWGGATAACAASMLFLDGFYLWSRGQGLQIEVEYSRALDAMLLVQLALVTIGGHRGRVEFLRRLFLRMGVLHLAGHARQGSEGRG